MCLGRQQKLQAVERQEDLLAQLIFPRHLHRLEYGVTPKRRVAIGSFAQGFEHPAAQPSTAGFMAPSLGSGVSSGCNHHDHTFGGPVRK